MEGYDKGYFEELLEESILRIDKTKERIKKLEGNIQYMYTILESNYNSLGIIRFILDEDLEKSKKNFYKGTLAREWTYDMYDNTGKVRDLGYVSAYVYECMLYGILTGSKERAIQMAMLFGGRAEAEKEDYIVNILLGYGLKYVILDDKEKAYEYINKIEELKDKRGMKQYFNGERRVYKGLIDRDEEEFNEGLSFLLKNHKSRMKRNGNTLEQYFAYDSLAYAMIAKERGLEITVTHELLPIEFLEKTDIDYSRISLLD